MIDNPLNICRIAALNVRIEVTDVNDNSPEFLSSHYTAHISKNSKIGTPILRLSAKDADEGENGRITYSLANVNF